MEETVNGSTRNGNLQLLMIPRSGFSFPKILSLFTRLFLLLLPLLPLLQTKITFVHFHSVSLHLLIEERKRNWEEGKVILFCGILRGKILDIRGYERLGGEIEMILKEKSEIVKRRTRVSCSEKVAQLCSGSKGEGIRGQKCLPDGGTHRRAKEISVVARSVGCEMDKVGKAPNILFLWMRIKASEHSLLLLELVDEERSVDHMRGFDRVDLLVKEGQRKLMREIDHGERIRPSQVCVEIFFFDLFAEDSRENAVISQKVLHQR